MNKILVFLIFSVFFSVSSIMSFCREHEADTSFSILRPELSTDNSYVIEPQTLINNESIVYMENQSLINSIDPKKEDNQSNYYPGFRGPNQLIVYTPKYGFRTGTNEYGSEAIVVNNMVIGLNGADSIIPYNGFVISGHGRAKKWIMHNIQVGTKVYIDYENKTIKCLLTPESLVFAAKEKIREVNSLLEYYRKIDVLYDDKKAVDYLNNSKDLLRKAEKKPEKTQILINEAMHSLDDAIKNALPYSCAELKGIWIRPVEDTAEKIEKTLDRMYNAGITDIFLETFYHGKTIYNSDFIQKYGIISQNENFTGFDPLEIWIREAHKRKMKVHIWFECFYIGNDNPNDTPNNILKVYPYWSNKRLINYNSKEPVQSLAEHNGYFLDPANPEVQQFLLGVLNEIVIKYKPDGINLDYIRYPVTVEPNYTNYASMNWGYTASARAQFFEIYGIDPINIQYGTTYWDLWSLFRQNKISDFVKNVKKIAKPYDIAVTAVIFPDIKKSIDTKMQNWRLWSNKDYVDGLTPLLLTGDKNTAVKLLDEVNGNINPATKIYSGIFVTFMGGTPEDLLLQLHKTREFKLNGSIIFDYAHLDDDYIDAINTRIYNRFYNVKENKFKEPHSSKDYKPLIKYKDKKRKSRR